MRAALRLAVSFALAKLLLQFALTLWSWHLGYSYFRDEFYFLACGRHLAWGYVDQGPVVALQARVTTLLFGDSVFGIRVLAALAGAVAVGLCGMLAWALGGGRSAQALAMLGPIVAPVYIGCDGYLSIQSLEPVFWMGCVLGLVLLQGGGSPRACWLSVGALAGLGLLNKPSMLFFLVSLIAALLLTPERRLLRTPWFAVAILLTLVLISPYLAWQFHNGWPTWEFLRDGQIENKVRVLSLLGFVGAQINQMEPINLLLWGPGLLAALWARPIAGIRWIGFTFLLFFLLMFRLHAKDYYLAPVYPMLFAVGAIAWERRFARTPGVAAGRIFAFPILETAVVVSGLMILPMASPVLRPAAWARYTQALHLAPDESENAKTSILPQFFADRFGWDQMARIVVNTERALPAHDRQRVCIFTNDYGQASSIEFLGRRLDPDLPRVISGHNNWWLWGLRGCQADVLIAVVHDTPAELAAKFRSVTVVGRTDNSLSMPYEHVNIYLLRGRKGDALVNWKSEKNYI